MRQCQIKLRDISYTVLEQINFAGDLAELKAAGIGLTESKQLFAWWTVKSPCLSLRFVYFYSGGRSEIV